MALSALAGCGDARAAWLAESRVAALHLEDVVPHLVGFSVDNEIRIRSVGSTSLGFPVVTIPLPLGDEPTALTDVRPIEGGLMALANSTPNGAVIFRPMGRIDPNGPCNPSYLRIFGRPVLTAAARSQLSVIGLSPVTADVLSCDRGLPTLQAVLRRDLGWQGVLLVDLRGIARAELATLAIRAIADGADMVLVDASAQALIDTLTHAARDGRLARSRIDDAATRILRLTPPRLAGSGAISRPWSASVGYESPLPEPIFSPLLARVGDPAEAGMSAAGLTAGDRAIETAIDDSVFTAAALAIGRRGHLVRLRGYGKEADGSSVDPEETLFDLASLTKVIATTTAVAMLVDEGRLNLDTPIGSYLAEYRGEDKDGVTARHLLTHTSGLPSGLWIYGSADSPLEGMHQVIQQPLRGEPGDGVEYSDLGLMLLGEIVERVTGERLDDFVARRLFLPLGMSSTMYLPPTSERERIIPTTSGPTERPYPLHGVVHDANAFRLGGVSGHAGLFSTARDVAVFAQMMLDGGVYGPVEILADSTVRLFTAEQRGAEDRALGWDTPAERSSAGRFFSDESFGHTGYTGTSLWIDPTRDLFVVLLTNRTYTDASAEEILDLRIAVHEAVARAITDAEVPVRPGAR